MMLMGGQWEKNVETLGLNHRQISRLDNALELFVNLRKLQLVDNCITKIEGLGRCKLLEEVSLEKNKISIIENIGHLKYLKKLDLGRNRIRKIDGL
jgi:Leucine-rich repeat (LRR) protein